MIDWDGDDKLRLHKSQLYVDELQRNESSVLKEK